MAAFWGLAGGIAAAACEPEPPRVRPPSALGGETDAAPGAAAAMAQPPRTAPPAPVVQAVALGARPTRPRGDETAQAVRRPAIPDSALMRKRRIL